MKLFVATPAYGGHVNVQYMQSILNLQQLLNRQNVEMQFYTIPFDSLIPRARTGFMMIKKKALKEFIKEHPELKYKNDIRAYGMNTETYDLFKCGVVDERYLSEDFYFCHMWRESGRKIYADLKVNTSHFGQFAFHASPVNLLQK